MSPGLELANFKIAVIIPTRNRPDGVQNLMNELRSQTKKPQVIIVVDSSDVPLNLQGISNELVIRHLNSRLCSAAHQRNLGLKLLYSEYDDFDLVCFLDDDLEIPADYLEHLSLKLTGGNAVGISGIAKIEKTEQRNIVLRLFSRKLNGRVTSGGLNYGPSLNSGVQKSEWLIGCSMWRVPFLRSQNHFFEGDFLGQSIFEDVIFSHRITHFGETEVDTDFIFSHRFESSERPSNFETSRDWTLHRLRFVTTDDCSSKFNFLVSSVGIWILALTRRFFENNRGHDAKGIFDGFRRIARAL